jgi:penicillin V acylase-like amidase (Ntn superfamily)
MPEQKYKKEKKKKEPVIEVDETMILVLEQLSELEERLQKVESRMGL